MKVRKEVFLLLSILIGLNTFCSSTDLNYQDVNIAQDDIFLRETVLNKTRVIPSVHNYLMLYDNFDILNNIIRSLFIREIYVSKYAFSGLNFGPLSIYKNLNVIIAENIKDGITLAEILSNKNRILPKRREYFTNRELLMYKEIEENFYFYYNEELQFHFFVYAGNMQNEILTNYLAMRIFEATEEFRVILTCQEEANEEVYNSMFRFAVNTFKLDMNYSQIEKYILFLPLSVNDKIRFPNVRSDLEKYLFKRFARFGHSYSLRQLSSNINTNNLNEQEKLEHRILQFLIDNPNYLKEYGIYNLFDSKSIFNYRNYVKISSKMMIFNFLKFTDTDENLKSLNDRLSHIGNSMLNEYSSLDMSTIKNIKLLKNLLNYFVIILPYEKFQNADSDISYCYEDNMILSFQSLFCFLQYTSNFNHNSIKWQNITESFIQHYLKDKEIWFKELDLLYRSDDPRELSLLYKDLSKIAGNDKDLMMKAFVTVNNSINSPIELLCSPLNDGTYKLQAKGKFLNLNRILNRNDCPGEITFLELLALEKIIINRSLKYGRSMRIVIFAPIWEIDGKNIIINLDPVTEENNRLSLEKIGQTSNLSFAFHYDLQWKFDKPGGSFFGITDTLIEAGHLLITINGYRKGISDINRILYLNNPIACNAYPLDETPSIYSRSEYIQPSCLINKPPIDDFLSIFVNIRKYIMNTTIETETNNYMPLYKKLNTNVFIKQLNTLVFVNELSVLESYYSQGLNKSILHEMYLSLQEGINQYANNTRSIENTMQYKKVLFKLDEMTSKRVNNLHGILDDKPVLKIYDYLKQSIEDGKDIKSFEILNSLEELSSDFKREFNKEIEEAVNLIDQKLEVSLENGINKLQKEVTELLNEVDKMKQEKKISLNDLIDKRNLIIKKVGVSFYFLVAKFAATVLKFKSSEGGAAAMEIANFEEKAALNLIGDTTFKDMKLPEGVTNLLTKFNNNTLLEEQKADENKLYGMIDALKDESVLIEKMSDLIKIDNQFLKNKNDIKVLDDFKIKMFTYLDPEIERFKKKMHSTTNGFSNSSTALLEYEQFDVENYLKTITSELDKFTTGFKIHNEVAETMTEMKNTINVIIRMHQIIKNFHWKIKNGDYIKNAVSAPFQINYINDEKLLSALTELEKCHYSSSITDDYDKLVIAMKGYTYPFSREYSDFILDPHMFFNSNLTVGRILLNKMNSLLSDIEKREMHSPLATGFRNLTFGSNENYKYFYAWNNSEHREDIEMFLKGEKVTLFANIFNEIDLNGVKFRDVSISITSSDPERNAELQTVLKKFSVKMIHHGNSYYRCKDKVHLIKSGASVTSTVALKDYILSPFATWTIQLEKIPNSADFDSLKEFVGMVNIELIGDGRVMIVNNEICNNDNLKIYGEEVSHIK